MQAVQTEPLKFVVNGQALSPFNWRGKASSITFQRAPSKHQGTPPPLLNGSARNGTTSINTERADHKQYTGVGYRAQIDRRTV